MSVTGRKLGPQHHELRSTVSLKCMLRQKAVLREEERDRLKSLLDNRRTALIEACEKHDVPLNPTMDGFFAWMEAEDPVAIAESCAEMDVYLVPLKGGVREIVCSFHQRFG